MLTKYPDFLREWDSRVKDKNWKIQPSRTLKVGRTNMLFGSDVKNILLLPFYIKLGITKQFVKALPKHGDIFKYLASRFSRLAKTKLKEVVLDGIEIRKLMTDDIFENKMSSIERASWASLKEAVKKFLGSR